MRLGDLVEGFPAAGVDDPAVAALSAMAQARRPGMIVLDHDGHPMGVLSGTRALAIAIPQYLQENPALASVVDAATADKLFAEFAELTVGDLMPEDLGELPVLTEDDTTMEAATMMARTRTPLVAVIDADGNYAGAVTVTRILRMVLSERA